MKRRARPPGEKETMVFMYLVDGAYRMRAAIAWRPAGFRFSMITQGVVLSATRPREQPVSSALLRERGAAHCSPRISERSGTPTRRGAC